MKIRVFCEQVSCLVGYRMPGDSNWWEQLRPPCTAGRPFNPWSCFTSRASEAKVKLGTATPDICHCHTSGWWWRWWWCTCSCFIHEGHIDSCFIHKGHIDSCFFHKVSQIVCSVMFHSLLNKHILLWQWAYFNFQCDKMIFFFLVSFYCWVWIIFFFFVFFYN